MLGRVDRSAAVAAERSRRAALLARRSAQQETQHVEQRATLAQLLETAQRRSQLARLSLALARRREALADVAFAEHAARSLQEVASSYGLRNLEIGVDGAHAVDVVDSALRIALRGETGTTGSRLLIALQARDLLDLTADDAARLSVLSQPEQHDAVPSGPAWIRWRDLVSLTGKRQPSKASTQRLADAAVGSNGEPLLELVDALIDVGAAAPLLQRMDGAPVERAYVLARTSPMSLTDEQVASLGWTREARRRTYLTGGSLDVSVQDDAGLLDAVRAGRYLEALDISRSPGVSDAHRSLAEDLAALLAGTDDATRWHEDRSLWGVLEAAAATDHAWRSRTVFTEWWHVRRAFEALFAGCLPDARLRAAAALDRGDASPDAAFTAELLNLAVYLAGIDGDRVQARLHMNRLKRLRRRSEVLTANERALNLVGAAGRDRFESPYAVLGLPEGAAEWKSAWRQKSKEAQAAQQTQRRAELNRARMALQSAGQKSNEHYQLPLQPWAVDVPASTAGVLHPQPVPLSPWTKGISTDTLDDWYEGAAAEAVAKVLGHRRPLLRHRSPAWTPGAGRL